MPPTLEGVSVGGNGGTDLTCQNVAVFFETLMSKFTQIAFSRPVQHMEIAISPKVAVKNPNLSLFWFRFGLR